MAAEQTELDTIRALALRYRAAQLGRSLFRLESGARVV
jgi:hypothetical protein